MNLDFISVVEERLGFSVLLCLTLTPSSGLLCVAFLFIQGSRSFDIS